MRLDTLGGVPPLTLNCLGLLEVALALYSNDRMAHALLHSRCHWRCRAVGMLFVDVYGHIGPQIVCFVCDCHSTIGEHFLCDRLCQPLLLV